MINRILIRVKALQCFYSYMLTKPAGRTPEQAQAELDAAFQKSHELYYYLLHLVVELTDLQDRRLDDAKHKFLPTEQDLNPDTRFVDNRLAQALRQNEEFNRFCRDHIVAWDDIIFLRSMLDRVLDSEPYADYMALEQATLHDDCQLWVTLLRDVLAEDQLFADTVEARSMHCSSEDIDVMVDFAIKTMQRIERNDPEPLFPMFANDEDSRFGPDLLERSIRQYDDNNALIDSLVHTERWNNDRVALMDRLIMSMAITELKGFDSIPTVVTLNEYIELAKTFSTPNSGRFVNGVLNAALVHLREQGLRPELNS